MQTDARSHREKMIAHRKELEIQMKQDAERRYRMAVDEMDDVERKLNRSLLGS